MDLLVKTNVYSVQGVVIAWEGFAVMYAQDPLGEVNMLAVFIFLQASLCFLSVSSTAFVYMLFFDTAFKWNRWSSIAINFIAIVLHCIVGASEKSWNILILAVSLCICFTISIIIDVVCKRKYFRILKSRIRQLFDDPTGIPVQTIRNKLCEQFDAMYMIKDVETALKSIKTM